MSSQTDPGTLLLAILEDVGFAVVVIDELGKIALANKRALTMWGEHSPVQGASLLEWRSLFRIQDKHGRDVPAEDAFIWRAWNKETVSSEDFRTTLPDGSVRWLHVIRQKFSVLGITGILVIADDETEQVLLRRAMERLQQIESLGHLTRGLIHDLNNMFSAISENLDLALADDQLSQPTSDRLRHIALALEKGTGLMKKLAQFSRAHDLQTQAFPINGAINTALELTRSRLGNKIRVNLVLDPTSPIVEGDLSAIEQALVNLILNAAEAMPDGGEIKLSTELVKRGAPGKIPGSFVVITVVDTGVGIPEEIQPRIFEPFFTTKAEKGGTGLGLSSVYGIVQQHQGEITVYSVPGQGTRFTIYLPVREPSPPSHEEAKSPKF